MKKLIKLLRKACTNCWGMKVIETSGGNTICCPACNGKGIIK